MDIEGPIQKRSGKCCSRSGQSIGMQVRSVAQLNTNERVVTSQSQDQDRAV